MYVCSNIVQFHVSITRQQAENKKRMDKMAQWESFQEQLCPVKLGGCLSMSKSKDLFQC